MQWQWLRKNAEFLADKAVYRQLGTDLTVIQELTFRELDQRVSDLAAKIATVVTPGERVVIALPDGIDYMVTLLGAMRAGAVVIPWNALDVMQAAATYKALKPVVEITAPRLIFVTAGQLRSSASWSRYLPGENLKWVTPEWGSPGVDSATLPLPTPEDLCLLQFTSGSTGVPKGVEISGSQLATNLSMVAESFEFTRETVFLSWLPLSHNMGLIGNALETLVNGNTCYFLSRSAVLKNPRLWAEAIARYQVTCSGGPAFAFNLLCDSLLAAPPEFNLSLNSWRAAFCGSEAIPVTLLEKIGRLRGRYGFSISSFIPCYGMAEATMLVTVKKPLASPPPLSRSAGQPLLSCGRPCAGVRIDIADAAGRSLPEGQVGEVLITSPTVSRGYWRREAIKTPLQSGDLGFLENGELYICGRLKEMIIIHGQNYYVADIENSLLSHWPAGGGRMRPVVLSVADFYPGQEELVILLAVDEGQQESEVMLTLLKQQLWQDLGLVARQMTFIDWNKIPLTASGKINRAGCLALLALPTAASRPAVKPELPAAGETPSPAVIAAFCRWWIETNIPEVTADFDVEADLVTLGLDSVGLSLLLGALEKYLNRSISNRIYGECQTVQTLADKLSALYWQLPKLAKTEKKVKINGLEAKNYLAKLDNMTIEELTKQLAGRKEVDK